MQLTSNDISPRFVVRCLTLSLVVSFLVFTFSSNFSSINHCNGIAFDKEVLMTAHKKLQEKQTESNNLIKKLEIELERKNELLQRISKEEREKCTSMKAPSTQYEKKRRRVRFTIQNLWHMVKHRFEMFVESNATDIQILSDLVSSIYEQKLSLLSDLNQMKIHDGYEDWRRQEASDLTYLIQKRLYNLQNPIDCRSAKILKCASPIWGIKCGWACDIERFTECFSIAYGTGRVLKYDSTYFMYTKNNYADIYLPLSNTCTDNFNDTEQIWPGVSDDVRILKFTYRYIPFDVRPVVKYLPPAIPSDLSDRLEKLYEEPSAWWAYQFQKFLLKLKPSVHEEILNYMKNIAFQKPIVGLHIRRTDKISEAKYLPVEKYMVHAEEYFDQLELTQKLQKRRVYLASDDETVLQDIKNKYPQYEIITNEEATTVASDLKTRYSLISVVGILTDIILLSKCDYVVCTFSSGVCTKVFHFMHEFETDAASKIISLDKPFYFLLDFNNYHRVVIEHRTQNSNEQNLFVNDVVKVDTSFYGNGEYRVQLNDSDNWFSVPAFKLEKLMNVQDFMTYDNVDENETYEIQ